MVQIGDTIGRYTLEARLGAGGMGEVFRAVDPQLRRSVALKVLLTRPGDDTAARGEWTARMVREARAAAAFNHPNAVAVYDVGEHEGAPFIVMELVPGRSLRSYLGDASVPLAEQLRWLTDVARALGAAHRAGLVHRDVKPDNVMVRDDGVVKILDFGIARQMSRAADPTAPTAAGGLETLTKTGATVGTPVYMAPEQLKLQPLDGRADQFSWAVVAFQLLAGRRPWEAPDLLSLVVAIASEEPPTLRSIRPEIPEAVGAAIARALSKRPEDRFATMDEAAAALDPHTSCCAKGLAAAGEDGLCGCPPGGSSDVPGAPTACPKKKYPPERILTNVRAHFGDIRRCYEAVLRKTDQSAAGKVTVGFELTPEGRVFRARVVDASLPDAEGQACVLRVFRSLTFDPPPDGHISVTYPIMLEPG
jgi:eukaryotic-like serine/threonine-protein kinase